MEMELESPSNVVVEVGAPNVVVEVGALPHGGGAHARDVGARSGGQVHGFAAHLAPLDARTSYFDANNGIIVLDDL